MTRASKGTVGESNDRLGASQGAGSAYGRELRDVFDAICTVWDASVKWAYPRQEPLREQLSDLQGYLGIDHRPEIEPTPDSLLWTTPGDERLLATAKTFWVEHENGGGHWAMNWEIAERLSIEKACLRDSSHGPHDAAAQFCSECGKRLGWQPMQKPTASVLASSSREEDGSEGNEGRAEVVCKSDGVGCTCGWPDTPCFPGSAETVAGGDSDQETCTDSAHDLAGWVTATIDYLVLGPPRPEFLEEYVSRPTLARKAKDKVRELARRANA